MSAESASAPVGTVLVALTVGRERGAVTLTLLSLGRDLLLLVTGGEAHAGAAAVRGPTVAAAAEPYAALSVVPGHREGPLAAEGAAAVAAAAGRACVAVAGIHHDGATPAEIAAIVAHARTGFALLAARLRAGGHPPREEP